jgi:hypothetical protein
VGADLSPSLLQSIDADEQEVFETLLRGLHVRRALDVGTDPAVLPLLAATGASVVAGVISRGDARARSRGRLVCGDAATFPSVAICSTSRRRPDDWRRRRSVRLRPRDRRHADAGRHLIYSDFHPSWAFNGWRRTFQPTMAKRWPFRTPHSIEEHLDARSHSAGLKVVAVREPRLNGDDADPAVKAFRRKWGNPPVVAIFHAVKRR